jgi:hypothetical protein
VPTWHVKCEPTNWEEAETEELNGRLREFVHKSNKYYFHNQNAVPVEYPLQFFFLACVAQPPLALARPVWSDDRDEQARAGRMK